MLINVKFNNQQVINGDGSSIWSLLVQLMSRRSAVPLPGAIPERELKLWMQSINGSTPMIGMGRVSSGFMGPREQGNR